VCRTILETDAMCVDNIISNDYYCKAFNLVKKMCKDNLTYACNDIGSVAQQCADPYTHVCRLLDNFECLN
jgi:hypothetical protein